MNGEGSQVDVAVVGGGIVGVATALALLEPVRTPGLAVAVLEAEDRLAAHQTGHNSGVLHSGLYYRPGSLKATLCRDGRERLLRFCEEAGVPYRLSGKVVVATRQEELPRLEELERRGRENGLSGVRRLSPEALRELEPHASGIAALHVPEAGIVDYGAVTEAMGRAVVARGGRVVTRARLLGLEREGGGLVLRSTAGEIRSRLLVNCAGLQSDRVATLCGVRPPVRILPFRGDYFELAPERRSLVRTLVYPVPDTRFPFLGVHFTRRISDVVEVGPNAVLSLAREGYHRLALNPRDALSAALYPGLWRFLSGHLAMAAGELARAFSPGAFARAAAELVPEVRREDLRRAGCGIRAQAMTPDGRLVDDFSIVEAPGMVHVLNAPSPAATASLAIGRHVAEIARARL